jgi:hypothetical protein
MNTVGVLFTNTNKKYPAAPDLMGKFTLTEPFLKSCVEAWRAGRSVGPVEVEVHARAAKGEAIEFWRLSIIPPKAGP